MTEDDIKVKMAEILTALGKKVTPEELADMQVTLVDKSTDITVSEDEFYRRIKEGGPFIKHMEKCGAHLQSLVDCLAADMKRIVCIDDPVEREEQAFSGLAEFFETVKVYHDVVTGRSPRKGGASYTLN
jgi:hypothetical protein